MLEAIEVVKDELPDEPSIKRTLDRQSLTRPTSRHILSRSGGSTCKRIQMIKQRQARQLERTSEAPNGSGSMAAAEAEGPTSGVSLSAILFGDLTLSDKRLSVRAGRCLRVKDERKRGECTLPLTWCVEEVNYGSI